MEVDSRIKAWLNSDASGGVGLIVAAALAMLLANCAFSQQSYFQLLHQPVDVHFGALNLHSSPLHAINDALMALFFLAVGLEIKRELVTGALAKRQQAIFPLIAALGGMFMPGVIFMLFNGADDAVRSGWAIPTATDIAFAIGILALLGSRVPPALKTFLLALAIIDDLGAIVIIALFYTSTLSLMWLGMAALAVVALLLMNRLNVRHGWPYLLIGLLLWAAIAQSGIHATLAGVITGLLIPLQQQNGDSPAMRLEHGLQPWVRWCILPLFAFANAGISLQGIALGDVLSPLPLGIIAGLLIGKPAGITLFCWLAVKLRLAVLPERTTLGDIAATGVLCGLGFTMSIFIASLAYSGSDARLIVLAKLGILLGSLLSAVSGYLILRRRLTVRAA